ncbi:MAG: hypothetical protein KGN79_10700 [Acidobacteriota bacterium]|nr:hypothetical protein [Acidobacteriota bacterium]
MHLETIEERVGTPRLDRTTTLAGVTDIDTNCDGFQKEVGVDLENSCCEQQTDVEWESAFAFIKEAYAKEVARSASRGKTQKVDPLYLEIKAARRRTFIESLKSSYSNHNHTLLWATTIFSICQVVLIPFGPTWAALTIAFFVAFVWAAVHSMRYN